MPLIKFVSHDNIVTEVHVATGTSVMQAAVSNSLDAIVAECGGSCACGTCHVYVDERWQDKIPLADACEQSMLSCVVEPANSSRLSCQIKMTDDLDGLIVKLPESQF